ncbi:D-tagatose-bisphosphate aldolase, class II, non-catalytic subunit [Thalassotalea fonticola]|uniref:D-tagatose-bisphosphate aldolase, class II, non-catalytic subunit n=1 Tax=Thalassotalea fonticola TaxID=3065649 RepID=A0ABZ0GLD6_9GAMM|nr:D-tagatose-bisphosphate aldolase, class II, non-catalytic subunit [Colwelliaceae bacterium S1-1]
MQEIVNIIQGNLSGNQTGIYAVCCAQPLVIEAAIVQAKQDNSPLLVEATANQVNQFGGYTGMYPKDFINFIHAIANRLDFPVEHIILGGDHLGPVCWVDEPAASAMEKSKDLIAAYVEAGFKKIHLDCSMGCLDDPEILSDEIVARRAAELCEVAEETAKRMFGSSDIVYVVGTEVPPPGGATEELDGLELTSPSEVKATVEIHQQEFYKRGLGDAWQRVIGLVVQPGVEFDHTSIIDYETDKATDLSACIHQFDGIAFEAHSTDYQNAQAYQELVTDHFAILKVGPQLTYAMREALFALSYIEDILVPKEQQSCLRDICEAQMQEEPKNWQRFYQVPASQGLLYRRYSYSDRIRYYWNDARVNKAVEQLLENLSAIQIPMPLISQFLPDQYQAIRQGKLSADPKQLVLNKIMQVTAVYAEACYKQEL